MHDNDKSLPTSVPDDIPTICAVAVIAICITTFAHEALGHGSACLLLGGHVTQLTSVYFQCSRRSGFVAVAGPAGNYAVGVLALLAQRIIPRTAATARLLALLVMALSFFWEAGYLVASMLTGQGDYFYVAQDFFGNPQWPWRAAGVVAGLGLYVLFIRLLGVCVRGFTTDSRRVSLLLGTTWLTAMVAACLAAVFYAPNRGDAFSLAAAEVAGAFPLLYPFNRVRALEVDTAPTILRSRAWIGCAIVIFGVFAATLGRGLP